jgi:hypothetical protein
MFEFIQIPEKYLGLLDDLMPSLLSPQTRDILSRHSDWVEVIIQARSLPPFPLEYYPSVIEVFDEDGLLVGWAWGEKYEAKRHSGDKSEFTAWCLDGQLGLFQVGNEVVVNRLELIAQAAAVLVSREAA